MKSVPAPPLPPSVFASILLFVLSLPATVLGLDFTPEEQAYLARKEVIKVHNETDWPPFNFFENGKPQGISIEVMDRVAEIAGLKIEYVSGPSWDEFLTMMGTGRLDVMLNIVDLPERRGTFRFTDPYAKSLTGLFVRGPDAEKYVSFTDLAGKTVAVPAGFDLEINLPKYHPEVRMLPVRDVLECIEALHAGRADAFMEEIGVADYIISQRMIPNVRLAFQVSEEPFISNLSIGTRLEDETLHAIIQKGLNGISGDELNKIRKKWLLQASEVYEQGLVNLTVAEKHYLARNKSVDICVDPSWPPLDFVDSSGKHSGLSADLMDKIAARLGLTTRLVTTETWEQSLQYLKERKCDIIPLMNETEEARAYTNFTQSYFKFATVIATRKGETSFIADYSELYGKKVALQAYFFITEYVREYHPEIDIIEVENTEAALKLVSEQKAYATIDGLPTVVNTIEALALENIKIVGSVPQENQMKLGVRNDDELLLSIFTKAIASLTEKEKVGLYRKWFDIEVENQLLDRSVIIRIVAGFSLVLVLLLWRHFTLNKYTKKLKELNSRLHYTSTVDHLTRILNRKSIEKRLAAEIERSEFTGDPVSLVVFDIDHFKSINDTHGHLVGDSVLKEMAALVTRSIRGSDHLGRWGGEEFLIVLPATTRTGAEKLIRNLKNTIGSHDFGVGRPVTVSFGIGEHRRGEAMTAFLSRIDDCLYEAKKRGRNRIVLSEETSTSKWHECESDAVCNRTI